MRCIPIALLAMVLGACAPAPAATPGASTEATTSEVPMSEAPMSEAPASTAPMSEAPGASDGGGAADDPLLAATLTDVRTGETFTLAELAADEPVIVEMMAIWCSNCRAQMHQITAAHDLAEFHSVSIDVDPSEIAEDLTAYAAREGFDWPFALADATLATQLRDRFGNEVLFPPNTPKLLVRTDGSVELLPLGQQLSADEIATLVGG
jgi:thiol-disulfide isomerase/thioredoxin